MCRCSALEAIAINLSVQCHDGHGGIGPCFPLFWNKRKKTAAQAAFLKPFLQLLTQSVGFTSKRSLVLILHDEGGDKGKDQRVGAGGGRPQGEGGFPVVGGRDSRQS